MYKQRSALLTTLLGMALLALTLVAWLGLHAAGGDPPPYIVDLTGAYDVRPLLTVGEEMPRLAGPFGDYTPTGDTFATAGRLDGLGVFATGDAYYVFANHEINAAESSRISSTVPGRVNGARVSLFQFTHDWEIVGGKNLIDTAIAGGITYTLNLTSGDYVDGTGGVLNDGTNLSRFCSGYLAATGFVDGDGQPAPIWFAPEERGASGRGWAVTVDGTATAIDALGRYSKEQVLAASQYRATNAGTTVLISTEDAADGEIYLFVGTQTADDPNGFGEGTLYVLRAEDAQGNVYAYETIPAGEVVTATWTPIPDAIALGDGATLSDWVNDMERSTNFRRPEDIHEDPNHPGTFYVATTGHTAAPPGGTEPDNPYGKLYRFTLNAGDPAGPMSLELVLADGPDTGVSYDNLTVDGPGRVIIQEDRAGLGGEILAAQERYSSVLAYDITAGTVTFLFAANQGEIDPSVADDYGNWETSGVVEVGTDALGRSTYLLDVQAHSLDDADHVEGGQLVLAMPTIYVNYMPLAFNQ